VEALGENVDRDAVQGQRDEHVSLVWSEDVVDQLLHSREQFSLFRFFVGLEDDARKQRPGLGFERYFASLPCPSSKLYGCFQEGELVDPGGETAQATEVIQASEDAHQGVVGRFERDVVELVASQVREHRLATADLE